MYIEGRSAQRRMDSRERRRAKERDESMKNGIAVAGHICVDVVKEIANFPQAHGMAEILSTQLTLGGVVNNCGRSLARLDPGLPVKMCALIGEDGYGDELLKRLKKYPNLDTSRILRSGQTAFTDVLSNIHTRERAFLPFTGAAARFCEEHVDVEHLDCAIFHIGYILLMDALDAPDEEYGTHMARLLHAVQERGILTSVDAVTQDTDRYKQLMPAALRYADFVCLNEHEAASTTDIPLRNAQDQLILENMPRALAALKAMGVRRWVAVHAPEGGFGLDENGEYHAIPGAVVETSFIGGTVGAGDAFAAGLLLGAYRERPMDEALEYAIAASVSSLRDADASEGVLPLEEGLELIRSLPRRKF